MVSWRDRLRPASFRGVPFGVEATSEGTGRRTVVHSFPGSDTPLVQDLGRDVETVAVRAFVVGADYDLQRDALLAAMREPGPGELIHPHYGALRVRPLAVRVEHRSRDGGMAALSLTFIESGETPAGLFGTAAGAVAQVEDRADDALDLSGVEMAESVDLERQPIQALEGLVREFEALSEWLESLSLAGPLEQVARYRRLVERLGDALLEVASFPTRQAVLVREALTALSSAVESREVRLELYLDLLRQRPRLVGGAAAYSRAADSNATAFSALYRTMAAAEAVREASLIDWPTRQDAERVREAIQAQVDALMADVGPTGYGALVRLLTALLEAVPSPETTLPELRPYTPSATVPAVVLAHRLYGDRNRAAEIVSRNGIRHPGRVPAAVRLEVLSA